MSRRPSRRRERRFRGRAYDLPAHALEPFKTSAGSFDPSAEGGYRRPVDLGGAGLRTSTNGSGGLDAMNVGASRLSGDGA